jgi:metallo-beta-lactamase class B
LFIGVGLAITAHASGHAPANTVQGHITAAKAAAGTDHVEIFSMLCVEGLQPATPPTPTPPPGTPEPRWWHSEPAQVFGNLLFVGEREVSSWAVTTSDGIILVDTLADYSIEDEIVGGLIKLGFDPKRIKYAIISHGHDDHAGGAKYLQDHFGTRIVVSAADWELMDHDAGSWLKPKRDIVAKDGTKLSLGNTTLTLYLTPGHTSGTISSVIPVSDNGTPHVAVEWGGTAFNWFKTYAASAERFRRIAADVGAEVLIANHTILDGSKEKLPLVEKRDREPNPFMIGADSVQRYLNVADECAKAGLLSVR